jgi:hypothetical protein
MRVNMVGVFYIRIEKRRMQSVEILLRRGRGRRTLEGVNITKIY